MGWWIALAVLVLLAAMPLGASVVYDEDGPLIKVIAGFIRLKVFPAKKKNKKEKPKKDKKKDSKKSKKKKDAAKEENDGASEENPDGAKTESEPDGESKETAGHKLSDKAKAEEEKRKKKGGSILDFLPLVKIGLDFLAEFFGKKLHVNHLELKLTLAGGDPCDLALNYGRAWEALGNLWPRLEKWMVIQKRDVNIQCDFEGDKTLIYTRLDISITLGRLIGIAVRYGWRALVAFLKIRKKRKGGAQK